MYVDIIFILYIAAILMSFICLVFIGLIFVRKDYRINRTYIVVRRLAVIVMLTDLLYFIFYYREVVQSRYELDLLFRIIDYVLCNVLVVCWLLVLAEMIDRKKHRLILSAGVTVTCIRLVASVFVTTFFMGKYYDIADPFICRLWMISEAFFVSVTSIIIMYYGICGITECVSRLRRNYIMICSGLIVLWGIVQGVIDCGLFAGKYGISAWDMEIPDFTGAILFAVNLATCIFVFKEDFSPVFLEGKIGGESMQEPDNALDIIALDHKLTIREREVLGFLYQGFTNPEIAEELYISVNTVKKHIRNIYEKLDVNNRMELIHIVNAWKSK